MSDPLRMDVAQAHELLEQGRAVVLDVVSPAAWQELDVALPGALRIAPDQVAARFRELPNERAVIAYCT